MIKQLKRRNLFLTIVILTAALLLRLVAVWQLSHADGGNNAVFFPSLQSDMATYWRLSGELLSGSFSGEFYYQPFYYAVWLPILRWCWPSPLMVAWMQALLGAGTVFFALKTGRLLGGRAVGYWSGILTAVCAPLLLYTPYLIIANLQAFWLTVIGYIGVKILKKQGGIINFYWLSLTLGLAVLTRGNAYFLVPGVFTIYILAYKWRSIAAIVGTTIIVILVQLPFVWHNTGLRGTLTGPSTAAGQVLALGNTPEAPPGGRDFNTLAGPMEYPLSFHRWMEQATEITVAQQIAAWLKNEPAAFFELQFRKLMLFWDWRDIPNNVALFGEGKSSYIYHLFWTTGLILAVGFFSILVLPWRAWTHRNWSIYWILHIVIGYWAATAAFYNLSRFRAPVLPMMAVLGALAMVRLVRVWRLQPRAVLPMTLCGVAAVFMVFNSFDFYTQNCEAAVMRLVRPNGTHSVGIVLDNGPMSFGDWREFALKHGEILTKQFAKVSEDFNGKLILTLYCANPPQSCSMKLNGKVESFVLNKTLTELEYPVHGNKFTVENLGYADLFLVMDYQRNYGRTSLNGNAIPAELVAKLVADLEKIPH